MYPLTARRSSRWVLAGLFSFSLFLHACTAPETGERGSDSLNVTVTEPVERDYADIRESGVIRMITRYSSNTYFLHQGIEWGFEYELVREFAKEHDLALEVVIVEPGQSPYDLLNSGKGDLIAANYATTPERRKVVDFTRPYNMVNQVVVYSEDVDSPIASLDALEESGIPLTVKRNSSYFSRLSELRREGRDIPIRLVSESKDTESLLYDISQGKALATVADNNIYQAASNYMQGLVVGPTLARGDTIAWAVRKNADDLETELNRFLFKHFRLGGPGEAPKRSAFLNILRKRYFEGGRQLAGLRAVERVETGGGIISPYDELIKSVADSAGIDWLWIASIIAQETKFNPNSESWAGAVGLMQVLPRYSEVEDRQLLYDEEINIREGVRILSEHLDHYAYMDSTDRWAFALATYNAGMGHVADARRLAVDLNKNPNEWKNVEDALLKLMQRKYYKDARYGFCRGIETVRYVKEIMNRRQTYETILAMNRQEEPLTSAGMGPFGFFEP